MPEREACPFQVLCRRGSLSMKLNLEYENFFRICFLQLVNKEESENGD